MKISRSRSISIGRFIIESEATVKLEMESEGSQSDNELLSDAVNLMDEYFEEGMHEVVKVDLKKKNNRIENAVENKKKPQECSECGKRVYNLKNHMVTHVPLSERKIYHCDLCGTIFTNPDSRRKHVCNEKQCKLCAKANHHRNRIRRKLPHKCDKCECRFLHLSSIKRHKLKIHIKEKSIDCDICDKTFSTKGNMLTHKRLSHDKEKSYVCQFCSKRYSTQTGLKDHLRSHTKEKPYECNICGKQYPTSSSIRRHERIHSKLNSFPCKYCNKKFKTEKYAKKHMLIHTSTVRYPCRYCSKTLTRPDNRDTHERKKHPDSKLPEQLK